MVFFVSCMNGPYSRRTYFSPPKYKTLLSLFWTDIDIIGPKITWYDRKMNYGENRTESLKHRPKNCLKLIIFSKHLPLYFSRLNRGSPRKSWPCLPFQWCLCRSFFPGSSVVTQLDQGQWTSSSRLCLQGKNGSLYLNLNLFVITGTRSPLFVVGLNPTSPAGKTFFYNYMDV